MNFEFTDQQIEIAKHRVKRYENRVSRPLLNKSLLVFLILFALGILVLMIHLKTVWQGRLDELISNNAAPGNYEEVQQFIYKFSSLEEKVIESKFMMYWWSFMTGLIFLAAIRYWKISKIAPVDILIFKSVIEAHEKKKRDVENQ